jgi:TolA-binding protein
VAAASAAPDQSPVLARLDDLAGKVDQLQSRLDQLPKPVTQPDLEPLKQQLTALGNLPGKVETLDKRVDVLPAKIDEHGRKITTMMADIDGVRKQVSSLQTDLGTRGLKVEQPSVKNDERVAETSHEMPREIEAPRSGSLKPGVDLFRQKQYDQASEYFSGLTKAYPNDARVWYFAALARGLATREWTGQTEKLVSQGVEREKAGKPEKTEIDSAFSDLKTETGKDWLNYYRRTAH